MTIICKCGVLLREEYDLAMDEHREDRLKQRLGAKIVEHISRRHQQDFETAVQFSQFYLSWFLLTRFQSSDPKFSAWVEQGREFLSKLVAPPDVIESQQNPANLSKEA